MINRTTLHVVDHVIKEEIGATLISVFSQVLEQFGTDKRSVQCSRSIYASHTGSRRINGQLCQSISLKKGCCQVCPLSPTLSVYLIEPLALVMREDPEINGNIMRGH